MKKETINPETYKRILESASAPAKADEPQRKEAKADRTNTVLYAMIIILLIFGAFIYYRESTRIPSVYKYSNGDSEFEVRKITDTESEIQFFYGNNPNPFVMTLRYGPLSLEKIKLEDKTIRQKIMNDETVYLTFSPEQQLKGEAALAGLEVGKFIANKYFYNIPVKSVVTSPYNNNTIITCANATDKNTVIWVTKGKETAIKTEGNCILIEGPTETEMVKAADRLALYLVGIMP